MLANESLMLGEEEVAVPSSSASSSSIQPVKQGEGAIPSPEILEGTVTRYAPPSKGKEGEEEGLYETVWKDEKILYYGEGAYQRGRTLYDKLISSRNKVDVKPDISEESKKRKLASDNDAVGAEDEGDDDDDSEDENEIKKTDTEVEGTKRIKTDGPVSKSNLTQSLMFKSKYSVPSDTVLKWR